MVFWRSGILHRHHQHPASEPKPTLGLDVRSMSSRLLLGAGALVIILAAGHALAAFSGHAIMATQAFPLWGKRDLRREAALADLDAMRGREQAARDALDERIKVAFAQYYMASRALTVNREVIAVTRGMRAAAEAHYAAGQGDQGAVIKALGEETAAEIETARLAGDRAAAREVLNALLARPASAPLAEPLRLRTVPARDLAIASLVERARGGSPALATSGAEVDAARTRTALAEKAWYPDLTVGAGPLIQTNNRPPGGAATVGLNIPLPWGREASEQQAATAQLGAAEQHYEAALLDIQRALGEARERLKAARQADALGPQSPPGGTGGAQVDHHGLRPRARRSGDRTRCTAPGPRPRTEAAPAAVGRADDARRNRTVDRGGSVSRSRASRAAVILAAAAAVGLCSGRHTGHGSALWVPEAVAQTAPASEPSLVPVTLTPQRMQSIGVKTGIVEFRPVRDEIRTVGNIEADETRISDVQIRFAGWVQKVYADAMYKQVRQGQPLLTIYSPDLVTAEQDYLYINTVIMIFSCNLAIWSFRTSPNWKQAPVASPGDRLATGKNRLVL